MRKFIFLVSEDWYFCSHRLPLAIELKEAGHEVIVATRIKQHRQAIEEQGLRIVKLRYLRRSSLNVLRELATFFEILFIFLRERPDLVHLVAIKPAVYGSLAAKLLGVSFRVNALGGLGFIFSSKRLLAKILRPIVLWMFRAIFNDSRSRLILQNQNDVDLLTRQAGVDRRGIRLIRSAGVDLTEYAVRQFPSGLPVAMLVSRMLWDKGVGEFVEAARILRARGVLARYVLVGDPDKENPSSVSAEQLKRWHDEGLIEWWGHRANMPEIFAQAAVVCLPSYYGEGVPKVLIEAMACGRPIITTDMPGCRELVQSGKNGMLVQPKDSVELAKHLAMLLTDQSLCIQMGAAGRRIVENEYSLARVIDETMAVYAESLDFERKAGRN